MINPLKNDVGARHTSLMYSHLSSTLMSTEWMLSSTPIEVEDEASKSPDLDVIAMLWDVQMMCEKAASSSA